MSLSPVEQIKARLGIADVLGTYIKLEKAGGNFKARCPFHSEKTPSFVVSPDRDSFHCFGCNKSGDIFDFVSEIEGLDFLGALRVLADRAGVELKKENVASREKRGERDDLFNVMELATVWFEKHLYENNKPVTEYLKKRGLSGETAKSFRIGFVPEEWRSLYDYLASKGINPNIMEKAGLVIKSPKGYYDRFRSRIMFPIMDSSGRVVAFTGRIFSTAGESDEKTAKYVNSPETDLYNKSDILYGFDKAKMSVRKLNSCVLVEGQMDLIMSHQAGIENAVAVSGTALTDLHLNKIKRLSDTLIFAFDADAAGLAASQKGVDMALAMGFEVKVVSLSAGKDPADIILENPDVWKKAIAKSKNIIEFLIDKTFDGELSERILRKEVEVKILPYVARLESAIEKAHYISEIADRLKVREAAVWESLEKVHKIGIENLPEPIENTHVKKVIVSRQELLETKIIGVYGWLLRKEKKEIIDSHEEDFYKITGKYLKEILSELIEEKKEKYILQAEVEFAESRDINLLVKDLIHNLESEIVEISMQDVTYKMKECDDSAPEKKELLEKFVQLMKRKKELDR